MLGQVFVFLSLWCIPWGETEADRTESRATRKPCLNSQRFLVLHDDHLTVLRGLQTVSTVRFSYGSCLSFFFFFLIGYGFLQIRYFFFIWQLKSWARIFGQLPMWVAAFYALFITCNFFYWMYLTIKSFTSFERGNTHSKSKKFFSSEWIRI